MRLCGAVVTLILFLVPGTGAIAQETPKEPQVLKLSKTEQARWDKARAILAQPDKVELFSLDPNLTIGEYSGACSCGPDEKPRVVFQGFKVLGKTEVKDAVAWKAVLAVAGKINPGSGPRCFWPRHGIRATAGGKTVDLLICFECTWVHVFLDMEEEAVELVIDPKQQPILDKVLTDAKVPLPTPAKD